MLAISSLAQDYKSGKIDERIFCHDYNLFGRLLELNIPLSNLLDLDVTISMISVVEIDFNGQKIFKFETIQQFQKSKNLYGFGAFVAFENQN
jgi:hypothetical protein